MTIHIGPHCRELCGACFQKARPIEESTVGGVIGDDPKFHERCDACERYAPRSDTHHVHMDQATFRALRVAVLDGIEHDAWVRAMAAEQEPAG